MWNDTKLITWGSDRESALQRMIRALREFHIAGIESTIPFCLMVFRHKSIQKGQYSTHTLDAIKNELLKELTIHNEERLLAARVGAVQIHHEKKINSVIKEDESKTNNWVSTGRKDELR